ncbi:MAG: insulinase family protein [Candidatus Omnitrophica bacterium]|nr:insulinase family protein [Candidatus Omnitrophota bacterium]
MYKKTILDNGLRIVTHQMSKMQSAALGVWIKVGARYESAEFKGIAHYLEHLLFKGSKKYSCRKIKESIEGLGGSLNGFTSEELTCYLAKMPARYLELALDILSDMVLNPLLLESDIEKERAVILEEIKMYKDQPASYVHELLDELLWPNQPLGTPVIGRFESVSKIKREDLSLFKKKHYLPANIIISAAGLLEHNKFVKKIKNKFLPIKEEGINTFLAAEEKQDKPQAKLFYKDTEQTHLALGFHAFRRDHPLKHALSREKRGLAYEIGTHLRRFYDSGAFGVHAGIDNRKVLPAIKIILKELKKIKDKPISQDEFRRAKEFYLGQLMLGLEDTLDHMLWIGEASATLNRTYTLKDIVNQVRKVKRQDIREAANNIFKEEKLNIALVGPIKDSEQNICSRLHMN